MFYTGSKTPKRKVAPHSSAPKKASAPGKKKAAAHAKPAKKPDHAPGHGASHGHAGGHGHDGHGHGHDHPKRPSSIKPVKARMAMLPDGGGAPRPAHPKKHHEKHDKKPHHEKKTCLAHVTTKGDRHPHAGRIQVVPEPTQSHSASFSPGFEKDFKEFRDLQHLRRRSGSFSDFAKAVRKRDARKGGSSGRDTSFKLELAKWTGGNSEVTVQVAETGHCGGEPHAMKVTGPDGAKDLGSTPRGIHVKFHGHDHGASARPSRYTVHAKESKGHAESLQIEVFPSDQLLATFNVSTKGTVFEKVSHALKTLLKWTGSGEVGFEIGGSVTAFEGWREANDWQAYYATELSADISARAELSISISATQVFLHVPKSLSKFLPDLIVSIGVGGEAGAKGQMTHFAFPDSQDHYQNSLELRGRLFVHLGVEARADCGIASVSVKGDVEPGLTARGSPRISYGKVWLATSIGIDGCDLKVEVKAKALFVLHTTHHKNIHLWNGHTLVQHDWHLWPR